MAGRFVVKKGTTGKFRFSLLASNGKAVISSEAYETKRAALAGIASVRKLAAEAVLEDTSVAPKTAKHAAAKVATRSTAAKKPAAKTSAKKPAAKTPAKKPAARKR